MLIAANYKANIQRECRKSQ